MSNVQALSLGLYVQSHALAAETLNYMSPDDPRAILTANVLKLIDSSGESSVNAWALARGLNVRFIERITEGDHNTTLAKIDEIASACGIPAWQLLLPDFEPGKQIEAPLTPSDRELLERLKRLLG
jgi:hypothetical protein